MIRVGDTLRSKKGKVDNVYVVTEIDETDNRTCIYVADVESEDTIMAYGSKAFIEGLFEPLDLKEKTCTLEKRDRWTTRLEARKAPYKHQSMKQIYDGIAIVVNGLKLKNKK